MPGKPDSQFGLADLLGYCSMVDRGALCLRRPALEAMLDALERRLRASTSAPRLLTIGKAVIEETVTLGTAIDNYLIYHGKGEVGEGATVPPRGDYPN